MRYKNLEFDICIRESVVDSYIINGYDTELDRELTDKELDYYDDFLRAEIEEYSLINGSRYHK